MTEKPIQHSDNLIEVWKYVFRKQALVKKGEIIVNSKYSEADLKNDLNSMLDC